MIDKTMEEIASNAVRHSLQTTPNPVRPHPKKVDITSMQVNDALGFYLDHIFDAPHGTYKVESWDNSFGEVSITLKRPDEQRN